MRRKAVRNWIETRDCAKATLSWRTAFVLFVLLAVALQSLVTQTHIHIRGIVDVDSGVALAFGEQHGIPSQSTDDRSHQPADDPLHCPFCQQMLLAGDFVPPALTPLPLPTPIAAAVLLLAASTVWLPVTAHTWFGRAPPRL